MRESQRPSLEVTKKRHGERVPTQNDTENDVNSGEETLNNRGRKRAKRQKIVIIIRKWLKRKLPPHPILAFFQQPEVLIYHLGSIQFKKLGRVLSGRRGGENQNGGNFGGYLLVTHEVDDRLSHIARVNLLVMRARKILELRGSQIRRQTSTGKNIYD